ncbi:YCF48-related protein [Pseudomonas sp. RIT-PI-S]|uniref:WD40/YVTN/BNR-like repeat-containing protein n=1 Tax=Pseudomonas sp. RIT-PI-S TaxID=3035295 RepID=UPI0021D89EE5|nr:YCF48-related protein [Pseudomonas sp. RIT-PI-S]
MGKTLLLAFSLLFPLLAGAAPAAEPVAASDTPERALHGLLLDIATAGERLVAVGDRGQVLLSDDQGQHWRLGQVPSHALLTAVFFTDAQHGWAVGHDSQVLASTDGGEHWQVQHDDPAREAPLLDLWFADADRGLAIGAYGQLLVTTDGGAHWDDASERLDNPDQLHLNAIGASGDGSLFIVGEQGTLFRSRDAGEHWEHLDSPYQGSLFGVLATREPGTLLIYGLRGNLLRSTDSGDSWQLVPLGGAETRVDSGLAGGALLADGSLVIVGNAGTVLHSEDDGRSFSAFIRPDRQALAAVVQAPKGELWLVGQGGARRADSSGKGEGMQ